MHELPVIRNIFDICMKHALSNDAKKIHTVYLEVGELNDLEDQWMQRYFSYLSKDTIADGASLKIKRIPFVMKCRSCSSSFKINIKKRENSLKCPDCGNKNLQYVSGRDYRIENMEIS